MARAGTRILRDSGAARGGGRAAAGLQHFTRALRRGVVSNWSNRPPPRKFPEVAFFWLRGQTGRLEESPSPELPGGVCLWQALSRAPAGRPSTPAARCPLAGAPCRCAGGERRPPAGVCALRRLRRGPARLGGALDRPARLWLPACSGEDELPSHLHCWPADTVRPAASSSLISSAKWLTPLLLLKKFERLTWMKRKKIWRGREKNNGKSPETAWRGRER